MISPSGDCLHSINLEPSIISDTEAVKISDILGDEHSADRFEIIGSSNGLLCLFCQGRGVGGLYIVNHSTRVSKKVEKFNLSNLDRLYGFGYDHTVDDYKLAKLDRDKDNLGIYSLKTNSWKKVESCFPHHSLFPICSGPSLNGAIHWVCFDLIDPQPWTVLLVIVGFSLVDEKFWKIAVPVQARLQLGVFNGCLCTLNYIKGEFWVLKEYGMTPFWTKVVIEMPSFPIKLLVLVISEELLKNDELLFLTHSNKFALWNTRQRTSRDLILPEILEASAVFKVGIDRESLISPHHCCLN
ncbi:F-box/kelch-repeat protein At3g06240-like [Cornus florida]|uniref:F-box/kelch-repeat protein At3g06240-like n=1 Tax=Cornus florida TaxID=4283 RepID=UPI0028980F3E|nr:F-box/kelch-repeat protein At3g06240-like [Cornus florida]